MMAELARGGLERTWRARTRPGECLHKTTLTVKAARVERSICETCGHISVRFMDEIAGPIFRNRFARPADLAAKSPLTNPFSDRSRLGVKPRDRQNPQDLLLTA